MDLFSRFASSDHLIAAGFKSVVRRSAPLLLALGLLGGALLPLAPAQAAGQPDLDVLSCSVVDDPVNYGDGIDWYYLKVRYTNKGTAAASGFSYLIRPIWGQDLFSGANGNESYVVRSRGGLAPGQQVEESFWVTKHVVDSDLWGIFLDNNGFNQGTVTESKESNNHCTAWINPS
ncbi:MAG TPA: hypothetical protein VGE07_27050 [Herpetosiphonaceae bacterium]